MPLLNLADGGELFYRTLGSGCEAVVMAHSILWNHKMFEKQAERLQNRFKIILFDFRGHGQSSPPPDGFGFETLASDASELIERLVGPSEAAHFVGAGLGGSVGLRLALERPEMIRSLALIGSSACAESEENKPRFRLLTKIARWITPRAVMHKVMQLEFGDPFLNDKERRRELYFWQKEFRSNHRRNVLQAVEAFIDRKAIELVDLAKIDRPALVLQGEKDALTPFECAEMLRNGIAGARLAIIPKAGHMATVEAPDAVSELLEAHFESISKRKKMEPAVGL